jgi:hypothetical protein
MATDNLFDAFEEQRRLSDQLQRIVFGDPPAHPVGLLERMERLDKRLDEVARALGRVEARRPNLWLWGTGYLVFLVSGAFAMVAFSGYPQVQALLDMPSSVAFGLAAVFALAAALLFVGGYGWLDRGP